MAKMADMQGLGHPEGHNYEAGSPHLKHTQLREAICESLRAQICKILARKPSCRVLEVGAGHGDFTDVLLGSGAEVVVTEMSEASASVLSNRYRHNPRVRVVLDSDGQWLSHTSESFDLVVCISVLHHIPDYVSFLDLAFQKTLPGGGFVTWQDPLWYPRRSRSNLALDKGAYFAWRLGQGEISRGISTRARRLRGVMDESNPSDMVEYHVVRNGVDEQAVVRLASKYFNDAQMRLYWSTQSRLLQAAGGRTRFKTTFGVIATDAKGASVTA